MLNKLALDRIDTGFILIDATFRIIKVNLALEELAGKSRSEMLDQPIDQVFPRFGLPLYQQIMRDCLNRGQVRFCSGMMHPAFVLPNDPLRQYRCRQNLQVKRLELDGVYFALIQITDISNHYERVFHLKHLIKDLGADCEQAKATGETMRKQANYDHLTGVYNRAMFLHQLRYDIKQADRNGHQVAVLFLDLDGFKMVNDTFGHSAGDELLQQTANRLKDSVRTTDTVARFGGDEFALILTNTVTKENVTEVAGKICRALRTPYEMDGKSLVVSASIGCSIYPADSSDPQELIDLADRAMYRVKFGGKNGVACYAK